MPCSAHTLNLTVNDSLKAIEGIQDILAKCRSIASRFKKSTVAMYVLKEEQANRNEPPLKIIQDVSNRWNSTYLMLEILLKIKDSLLVAITKLDDPPTFITQEENKIIMDLYETLEPFYDATEQLSGDQYVSSSLIISIITEAVEPSEPTSSISPNEPASNENYLNDNTEKLKSSPAVAKKKAF
ncbi:unnamed protein product [Brassicogethes aeneus]|uniref:Uncharacterized protein n=1 Tax=Brassicogethes aeneus TaxID=1431903 RepID=A0A9P0BEX5_BRAAE|nr:unnamed protein product [Brassicogethes aeneus]